MLASANDKYYRVLLIICLQAVKQIIVQHIASPVVVCVLNNRRIYISLYNPLLSQFICKSTDDMAHIAAIPGVSNYSDSCPQTMIDKYQVWWQ